MVPGLASLVLIPLILYKVYPPEVKETLGASQLAKQKLAEMGKMHRQEWVMLGVFFLLLLLWILGINWPRSTAQPRLSSGSVFCSSRGS